MSSRFDLYYITDSAQLASRLIEECVADAIAAGVDWVQIREKHLPARRLLSIAEVAVQAARPAGQTRVLVNDRLDVALAAGAQGVHLGGRSLPALAVRRLAPPGFRVGVSCHSLDDALAAERAQADYLLLGPIFATPSKLQYGPPLGLAKLREVTTRVSIPVFALGGVTLDRVAACRDHGARGIAGIRIFQDSDSVDAVVRQLRAAAE
jgi:thiamine-phosphate pyrophosphorylase